MKNLHSFSPGSMEKAFAYIQGFHCMHIYRNKCSYLRLIVEKMGDVSDGATKGAS